MKTDKATNAKPQAVCSTAMLGPAERAALDALLDHIYEYGTAAEGVLERAAKLCQAARADERERCAGDNDLDAMCEAFHRLIEAHANLRSPFHRPVCADAQMALRVLRGIVAVLRA